MSVKLVLEGFESTGQLIAFLDWLGEEGEQYLIEWFEAYGVVPIAVDYGNPVRIKDNISPITFFGIVVTATIKSNQIVRENK